MPQKLQVYLDNNATTPMDPRVLDTMLPYFKEKFGNAASRNHVFGWQAEEAVQQAREQVANLTGARSREIVFTSGATEANNLAIKGVAEAYYKKGNHIITCLTEHKAVLDPIRSLGESGFRLTHLSVNSEGLINLDELADAITDQTILICIMYANNETGVIQPIKEIAQLAKRNETLLMTDATQAVGKIPINVRNSGIDMMSFSAHKFYGPKGAGGLFVRDSVQLSAQLEGGGHERGVRSGTLNVPGIVGMGKACELAQQEMKVDEQKLRALRDQLETSLLKIPETSRNGSLEDRLSHVTNISFHRVDGERLLLSLNDIAVSQGSACTSATLEPSHVLKSMGVSDELAHSSIRFGLGRFTTREEIEYTIQRVTEVVNQLRD
ncbi:MAG: IscS subfamily cysteine desulfurase [Cyclobacteriaceae bacterium]